MISIKRRKGESRQQWLKRLDQSFMSQDQLRKLTSRDLVDLIHIRINRNSEAKEATHA